MAEIRRALHGVQVLLLGAGLGASIALVAWLSLLAKFLPLIHVGDAIVLCLAGPVVVAALTWAAWLLFRRCKGFSEDLLLGTILEFQGDFTDDAKSRIHRDLLQTKLLAKSDGGWAVQTVEVLESADLIFAVNGSRLRKWVRARVGELKDSDPLPAGDRRGEAGCSRRRTLSAAEQAELRGLARPWMPVFLVGGSLTIGSSLMIGSALSLTSAPTRTAIALFVATLAVDLLLLIIGPGFLGLMGDSRRAEVQSIEMDSVTIEILPLSGRIWTIEGYPAEWRRSAAKAEPR
jgi:hypothetical protein